MLKLAKAVGGTRVYFPGSVGKDNWLVKIIGLDDARKLSDHFAGSSFTKTERHMRNSGGLYTMPKVPTDKVVDLGLSAREAALTLGVTMRCIHRRRAVARSKTGKR